MPEVDKPIYDKIHTVQKHAVPPRGWRIMSLADVQKHWSRVWRELQDWDIYAVLDGKVYGHGWAKIRKGEYLEFFENAINDHDCRKIFIAVESILQKLEQQEEKLLKLELDDSC